MPRAYPSQDAESTCRTRWKRNMPGTASPRSMPSSSSAFDAHPGDIEDKEPDAVLVSLVGDGSVQFNRQFGRAALSGRVVRLSTAIEENMLLAIGEANTEGLFSSAGYFACLKNSKNGDFWDRYHSRFGEYSPPLNAIGHSVYEGIHLLKVVFGNSSSIDSKIPLPSVRSGRVQFGKGSKISSLFLAEAQGMNFNIVKEFNDIV